MNTLESERQIYATDGTYFLCPIIEQDREHFVNLQIQTKGRTTLFLNPHFKDIMWNQVLQGKDKTFSILDIHGNYYGTIELRNLSGKTPEIGIALMEEYQNKGLAYKVLKMLIKETCSKKEIDYFLIRISSRNSHSKHVFEKMGAIFIRQESSFFTTFMNEFNKITKNLDRIKEKDKIIKQMQNLIVEEEIIYQYILLPELFI